MVGNRDRISNLPGHVLCHMLSFLETKYSVQTRILSKRWKYLYTLVPVLYFSCSRVPDLYTKIRFLDFVDWVFNSYNVAQMERFVISYVSPFGYLPTNSRFPFWISEAIRRGVRELDIFLIGQQEQQTQLPSYIFTCGTLVLLKIHGSFVAEVPDNVSLPHIKTLMLSGVTFTDACSASKLLRSFPVLEDLDIQCSFTEENPVLFISIPTLKSLKIYIEERDFEFVLDVPNVVHVEFAGAVIHRFSVVREFKLLRKACIKFSGCSEEGYEVLEKIVTMVCHVRHLCVSPSTLQVFQNSGRSLPIFCNLVHLEIKGYSSFGENSAWVLDLLYKAPRLEVFVVDMECIGDEHDENDQQCGLWQNDVPTCVSQHLKEVEFEGFSMLKYKCEVVEYILKNAKILNVLKIVSYCNLQEQIEINKKLLTFTRCSSACQIVIN